MSIDVGGVVRLASEQHGVVSMHQLALFGATSRGQMRSALSGPEWDQVSRFIWRVAGAPDTEEQRLMSAVLRSGSGSVLSHETAASRFGAPGYSAESPIHLTRGRVNSCTPEGTVVHRVRRMHADEVTVLDGLPIVRPFLIPFQLADAGVHPGRIERLIDRLWTDRLLNGQQLHDHFAERFGRGHRGRRIMRQILEVRDRFWVPPASGLEGRVLRTLESSGIEGFERQVDLGDGGRWIGRVDFFHRAARVAIEVQSDRFHTALVDRQADARRFAALEAAGFTVVEVLESEVWHDPERWIVRVRAVLSSRR